MHKSKFETTILLLQGGGALGAYQAGAFEGLTEAGIVPDWIVGISIGGINSALIAGNSPGRQVERLRTFWERISAYAPFIPPAWLDPLRPALDRLSATAVATYGTRGFFKPRIPPTVFAFHGSPDAISFYDTRPLNDTLNELVDFDMINNRQVRLSLGAANVETGESVYFDNHAIRLEADHVRASGALPPGFPPVKIGNDYFWDGGIISNSPMWYVLDNLPKSSMLIIQLDVFNPRGALPGHIATVQERAKDIEYASRTRFSLHRVKEISEMHAAIGRLLDKLPPELRDDPDVRMLAPLRRDRDITVVHLINRHPLKSAQMKDYEFSRATVSELWAAGLEDIRHSRANIDSIQPTKLGKIRIFDLPLEKGDYRGQGELTT
jgi:NTE family protein